MDNTLQTSFIPKKPINPSMENRPKRAIGLLGLIGTIIFIITLILAGGVFGYKKILEGQKTSKIEYLDRSREEFPLKTIQEFRRLDKRLIVSNKILSNHIAPSAVFDLLSKSTLKSVKFDNFTFNSNLTEEGYMKVTLRGTARNYASVALQADEFGRLTELRQPVVSDLNLDQRGNVVFSVNTFVDPKALNYKSFVTRGASPSEDTSESPSSSDGNSVNTGSQSSGGGSQTSGSQTGTSGDASGGTLPSVGGNGAVQPLGGSSSGGSVSDEDVEDFEAL